MGAGVMSRLDMLAVSIMSLSMECILRSAQDLTSMIGREERALADVIFDQFC